MGGMKVLSTAQRSAVIGALCEGNSINSTVRMTGVSKPTILKLIRDLGTACQRFHDERVVNLKTKRVQCDEIWAFCHCKKANTPEHLEGVFGVGDVWTWTAIDADSKLMLHWMVGERDAGYANEFMRGLAPRLACRIQITTDGLHAYWSAVGNAFDVDSRSDYAVCKKIYADAQGEGRYSPGECTGVEVKVRWGDPDPRHISTSFVERSNLTMRMGMRRYTRLTNAFSKKVENHIHMTTIFFTFYNWCRVHQTLRTTPAVAAGLTTRAFSIADLIELI